MKHPMNAKERAMNFYHHLPTDEVPTDKDIVVLFDPAAYEERPPFVQAGIDWFGVEWIREENVGAICPNPMGKRVLDDIEDWKDVIRFPDLDAWDWDEKIKRDQEFLDNLDRENSCFCMMFVNGPFERLHMLMGFEEALVSLLTNPEDVQEFTHEFITWKMKLMDYVKKYYNPDVLMFHDDWGAQNGMFFSPDVWREIYKPEVQRAVDHCHELGMIYEHHSCGNIEAIVPEMAEMGMDAWQGQEINNIPKLKEITKDTFSYHVTPVYMEYEAAAEAGIIDEAGVRAKVAERFHETAKNYCYAPMFLPFGGWASAAMKDEVFKLAKTEYQAEWS